MIGNGHPLHYARQHELQYLVFNTAYVFASPIAGIIRIGLASHELYKLGRVSKKRYEEFREKKNNFSAFAALDNYSNLYQSREFWWKQIARGCSEIALPIIAAVVWLLKDLIYVRPKDDFHKALKLEREFDYNYCGYEEVKTMQEWRHELENFLSTHQSGVVRQDGLSEEAT